ncbi:MAG: hypothetical protein J6P03_03330 [Opitutales bacterium]|nr:hypothetical protein [Opitutales bacterium]
MGLPKGYKKTWNSGGGRPKLSLDLKKKSVNIYLTESEKSVLDALRGPMSVSKFIREKLGLNAKGKA